MFPLQESAGLELIPPQFEYAPLRVGRRSGEERKLLAELLRPRTKVRQQLAVSLDVLVRDGVSQAQMEDVLWVKQYAPENS